MTIATRSFVTRDGRLRLRMPGSAHMVYKSWDDMTEEERAFVRVEHPDFAGRYGGIEAAGPQAGRYQAEIEYYEQRLEECRTQWRHGRDGVERGMAKAWGEQLKLAIQNLKEAEQIPEGTVGWFVSYPGQFETDMPPVGIDGLRRDPARHLSTTDHVIRTTDPEQIAWLRHCIRMARAEDDIGDGPFVVGRLGNVTLCERPVGEFPLLSEAGDLLSFGSITAYWRQQQSITRLAPRENG